MKRFKKKFFFKVNQLKILWGAPEGFPLRDIHIGQDTIKNIFRLFERSDVNYLTRIIDAILLPQYNNKLYIDKYHSKASIQQ